MEALAFYLFAAMVLGGALLALFHKSVVHSAFALVATFSGIAGFYILLGADFLAVTQVLIYVGGIMVLILFGVMLSPPDKKERSLPRITAALVVFGMMTILIGAKVAKVAGWMTSPNLPDLGNTDAGKVDTVVALGKGFLDKDGYLMPFELSAIVLLMALVGSVYIARRRREVTQ